MSTPRPLTRLRALCLALPDAIEKKSHGEPTFWSPKRMFAMFANAATHQRRTGQFALSVQRGERS